MRNLAAFFCGGLFGSGLYVSGMTDTTKVQGWLDIFGEWDPTLAFVLGGAILPMAIAWAFTEGRTPLFGGTFPERPDPTITPRLVTGSVLFGAGWALVGLCPGPALASLGFGGWPGALFALAMIFGMWLTPRLGAARPLRA